MSNTFVLGPVVRMRHAVARTAALAATFAAALVQIGCGESTEIRGWSVASIDSETTGFVEKAYVMDTGRHGLEFVESVGDWNISCSARGPEKPHFTLVNVPIAIEMPDTEAGYSRIYMREHDGNAVEGEEPNVAIMLGPHYYTGFCEVRVEKKGDHPFEAYFTASICREMKRSDGAIARLDSGFFHLKCCEDDC